MNTYVPVAFVIWAKITSVSSPVVNIVCLSSDVDKSTSFALQGQMEISSVIQDQSEDSLGLRAFILSLRSQSLTEQGLVPMANIICIAGIRGCHFPRCIT